jgi:hypothetical protein
MWLPAGFPRWRRDALSNAKPERQPPASPAPDSNPPLKPSEWAARRCNFRPDPQQAAILDCADPRVILLTARQVGKSTIAALRALYIAVHKPKSLIFMVAPIETQAGEILHKLKEFAAELGLPLRGDGNNPRSLQLPNGSRIVARSAIARSVRGFSKASLIIIDEAAFVHGAAYRALSPILAVSQGHLWVLSTPYGRNNVFAEIWHDHQADWTRFAIRAADCPRLTPEFLAAELRLHGELSYAQEYDCRFISHGLQLLTREQVAAALIDHAPVPVLGLWEKTERYYGLDLGKRQDHTALVVLELTWQYGAKDPATQRTAMHPALTVRYAPRLALDTELVSIPGFVRAATQRFDGEFGRPKVPQTLLVDATGNGHAVIELLRRERHGLRLLPVCISSGRTAKHLKDSYLSIPRSDLLTRLKLLFERGQIKLERSAPGLENMERELLHFETAGHQSEHDDLVMALGLAAWQATTDHPSLLGLPESTGPLPQSRLI